MASGETSGTLPAPPTLHTLPTLLDIPTLPTPTALTALPTPPARPAVPNTMGAGGGIRNFQNLGGGISGASRESGMTNG